MPPIAFVVFGTIVAACCWLAGEALNKPLLRRISAPAFSVLLSIIGVIVTGVHISFSNSIIHSGATHEFVDAVVAAIDRGDVDAAHAELRRYNDEAFETYEGGAFLKWLREPTRRLNGNSQPASDEKTSGQ